MIRHILRSSRWPLAVLALLLSTICATSLGASEEDDARRMAEMMNIPYDQLANMHPYDVQVLYLEYVASQIGTPSSLPDPHRPNVIQDQIAAQIAADNAAAQQAMQNLVNGVNGAMPGNFKLLPALINAMNGNWDDAAYYVGGATGALTIGYIVRQAWRQWRAAHPSEATDMPPPPTAPG